MRGVSHIQGDGKGCGGVSHVQGDGRGEGRASAMFKLMGRVRGVSHVQGNGGEVRQPWSRR